jgi:Flp pilus assembly protein TadG
MMALLRSLRRNRTGNAAAELALLAPLLAAGLFASVDLAAGFSMKFDLVAAAARAAELATAPGVVRTDYTFLQSEAVAGSGIAGASATVSNWLECNGTKQASGTNLCAAGQEFARYVSVQITAPYQPLFNYGGLVPATGIVLEGSAAVRIQ